MSEQEVNAIEIYVSGRKLLMQPYVIERAVRALSTIGAIGTIEALALIRGAYASNEGAFASLDEAWEIFGSITTRR